MEFAQKVRKYVDDFNENVLPVFKDHCEKWKDVFTKEDLEAEVYDGSEAGLIMKELQDNVEEIFTNIFVGK